MPGLEPARWLLVVDLENCHAGARALPGTGRSTYPGPGDGGDCLRGIGLTVVPPNFQPGALTLDGSDGL